VATTGDGRRVVFLGAANGSFKAETSPELVGPTSGCRGYDVAIRDLDGDGRGEVIMSFAGEPGSEVLLQMAKEGYCRAQGDVEAWHPMLLTAASGR